MGEPRTHTQQPIVTGTSCLGVKYRDGVLLAADTLASYGSLARFKDMRRMCAVGQQALVAASGEMSDFQAIQKMLEQLETDDRIVDDGHECSAKEVHSYLRAVMYNRRNKFNPLWNQLLVAGYKKKNGNGNRTQHQGSGEAKMEEEGGDSGSNSGNGEGELFLGTVDLIGTAYEEDFIATGFGGHLALPMMRERWHADMDEGEAVGLLEDCLRVLFYRDCRASNRIQIAKANADGVLISEPYVLDTNWEVANFEANHPTGTPDGSSW